MPTIAKAGATVKSKNDDLACTNLSLSLYFKNLTNKHTMSKIENVTAAFATALGFENISITLPNGCQGKARKEFPGRRLLEKRKGTAPTVPFPMATKNLPQKGTSQQPKQPC